MASYKLELPKDLEWAGADFSTQTASVWGSGNDGVDLWGYPDGAPIAVSDPLEDSDGWYIIVTLNQPGPTEKEGLAFITRFVDATNKQGVFATNIQYNDEVPAVEEPETPEEA